MGFFNSFWRFLSTIFGLAEGTTERATDKLLTASPDAISSQFRKTREDWIKDYNQMKDAVAELCKIREAKTSEVEKLNKENHDLATKMTGAIETYKKNGDERLREAYGRYAAKRESITQRTDELVKEITEQAALIETYKTRLTVLQENIEHLKQEEAETISDIVYSRKVNELNDRLKGLSQDTQTKNIEAIRDARLKAKATAKLSNELNGTNAFEFENKLIEAGAAATHLSEFDEAVKLEKIFTVEPKQLQAHSTEADVDFTEVDSDKKVEALFKK